MFNRCSHKFGDIQKDGYQYCKKCNKAISIPCNHKWKEQEEYAQMIVSNATKENIGMSIILKCEKCGELKTFYSRVNDRT